MLTTHIDIATITVPDNYPRVDMGNIEADAESIKTHGQLQAIAVREIGAGQYSLIFGRRRLEMARVAKLPKIRADIYSADEAIDTATFRALENSAKKDPTMIELLMMADEMYAAIGEQRGRRVKADSPSQFAGGRVDEHVAQLVGFGSKDTLRRARAIRESGTPDLIQRVNDKQMSIRFAADIASHPQKKQRELIVAFDKRRQEIGNEALVSAKEARTGKKNYHETLRREREERKAKEEKDRKARVRAALRAISKKTIFPIVYIDLAGAWESGAIAGMADLLDNLDTLNPSDWMHAHASLFIRAYSHQLAAAVGIVNGWGMVWDGAVTLHNGKLQEGVSKVAIQGECCMLCVAHNGAIDSEPALPAKMNTLTNATDYRVAGWKLIHQATGGEPGLFLFGDEQRRGWAVWPQQKNEESE